MRWFIGIALAFLVSAVCNLSPVSASPNPSIRAVVNGIEGGDQDNPAPQLSLSAMNLSVQVHGRMAEVTIEVTVFNPSDEEVEARFALTMPQDAVVTGYALDINGKLIDGVLIDQPKAKAVYEDEIREKVDPGLAEVTRGNQFRTRIYPIDAQGSRTVRLRFVAPVDVANGLVLPLETESPVGTLKLTLRADGMKTPPRIGLPQGGSLAWIKKSDGWRASFDNLRNRKLTGPLALIGGEPVSNILVSHHANGRDYFQIADFDAKRLAKPQPIKRVRVYWDASLSRRDDLLVEERNLLAAFLAVAKPEAIDLVRFTTTIATLESFATSSALDAALAPTLYRGGTSFKGLDDVLAEDADLCLLFSDGQPTFAADAAFRPRCRLATITSAPDANSVRLGRMARAARGQFLRLTADNGAALVERLMKPSVAVVDVRDSSGARLPFRTLAAPGGNWLVVGKMPDSGDVMLRIAGLRKGIAERIYTADAAGFGKDNAAGALWAVDEVEQIADDPLKRGTLRQISQSHQVASPSMAFLVLERPDQYLRADIKPPAAFDEEWMSEYRDGAKERRNSRAEAKKRRLDFALEQWAERKAWWNKSFAPPKRVKQPNRPQESGNAAADAAAPASPVVALPPPAAAGNADSYEGDADNIIVTGQSRSSNLQSVPLSVTVTGADGVAVKVDIADVLSDQPYLRALDAALPAARLGALAEQEITYGSLPAFYFDTAEWFRLKGDVATAEALLLSALELPSADDETRLIVAFRLQRAGAHDEAVRILELAAVSADARPQPRRSLALALIERAKAKPGGGLNDLERAFTLLTEVALDPAINDFDGIETVALMEANAIIPRIDALGGQWTLDPRLVALLDTDVRITIEWTNDDADIDLWVIEPTGEKTYYRNHVSASGGLISNDMTDGYGPEEYVLHKAVPGQYRIKIDGYSPDRLNPNGKGRVMVRMIRDFARPTEHADLVDAEISFDQKPGDDDEDGKLIAKMTVAKK